MKLWHVAQTGEFNWLAPESMGQPSRGIRQRGESPQPAAIKRLEVRGTPWWQWKPFRLSSSLSHRQPCGMNVRGFSRCLWPGRAHSLPAAVPPVREGRDQGGPWHPLTPPRGTRSTNTFTKRNCLKESSLQPKGHKEYRRSNKVRNAVNTNVMIEI